MRCLRCGHLEDRVIDSRLSRDGDAIRRRRECLSCGHRFTTYEHVELSLPAVIKRDGRREPYQRAKLVSGLRRACEKRPVSIDTLEAAIDRIERGLASGGEREVPAQVIGDALMEELKGIDAMGYLRFASVYRSFQDMRQFLQEAERVARQEEEAPRESAPPVDDEGQF